MFLVNNVSIVLYIVHLALTLFLFLLISFFVTCEQKRKKNRETIYCTVCLSIPYIWFCIFHVAMNIISWQSMLMIVFHFRKGSFCMNFFFCIFTKLCVSIESICLVSFSSFHLLSYFWIKYSISVIFVYCLHLKVRIVLQRLNNSTHRREQKRI